MRDSWRIGSSGTSFCSAQSLTSDKALTGMFDRGYAIPDARYDGSQKAGTSLSQRQATYLFLPPTEAMRRDARFAALVEELGLARFWRENRITPDYQRG